MNILNFPPIFCIGVLFGCVLALRFMYPSMTETQLFLAFTDVYMWIVAGLLLAWYALDRINKKKG